MFVMRQLNSRINSAFVSMTVICIISLADDRRLVYRFVVQSGCWRATSKTSPYDATVYVYDAQPLGFSLCRITAIRDWIWTDWLRKRADLNLYDLAVKVKDYCRPEVIAAMQNSTSSDVANTPIDFLPLSQLNAALAMQGNQPLPWRNRNI